MSEPIYSERAKEAVDKARALCHSKRNEFITPEHLLSALLEDVRFNSAFYPEEEESLVNELKGRLDSLDTVPDQIPYICDESVQLKQLLDRAELNYATSSAKEIDIPHLVHAMLPLENSWAVHLIRKYFEGSDADFMNVLMENYNDSSDSAFPDTPYDQEAQSPESSPHTRDDWQNMVMCMNSMLEGRNPLVGREDELQRTIRVLCRKDKNNPLHVGEPGVGKTALVWGLVARIEKGDVPQRLQGSKVYMMDLSSMVAGTQYRGDFEKRLKAVMDGIMAEGHNNIVYIDEIHMIVGAGATGEGSMDASNILKPYLEDGTIRFIGSTTYEEFNRHFSKSKGLVRRFQQIDIAEPSAQESKHILRQLQPYYEEFHNVSYTSQAIDFAVDASSRHITDRFLPDKAIDLIDEAGAHMETLGRSDTIGKTEIAEVLARICKVDSLAEAGKEDYEALHNLSERLTSLIYGQDEAIRQVVEAVQMARAGLLDEDKPLASLLFVGPTGVGKTEVARVLSSELGVPLIRFDMSEYAEKHSIAKLIGSPAGYVGYDDGGQLTDAIRKSPNCVLLLDEVEKAHEDIYDILLQVMDYGRLTDNKGRQSDFRNVILIMTSNAGARFASQAGVGFASTATRGGAMMKQVKQTFKPEFLNRLSGTVVFNDMDRDMATLILQKKLRQLETKLAARKVSVNISEAAFNFLLNEGFTPQYGAREMDRVIRNRLNPLLMREILFGFLKNGGKAYIVLDAKGALAIRKTARRIASSKK